MVRVPQVGDSIGRYLLLAELGQGGMAVVYRATDTALNREVALKMMHPHLWAFPEYVTRFAREARAVAALRHPNIVEIYDYGQGKADEEGREIEPGFIVSELVKGPTLRQFIDGHGHLLPEVAAMVVCKIAEALQCAHAQGIVHRDLKPENVIIAEGGRPVLTDFGVARMLEGESLTQTGAMLGSPAYMSPEQAKGEKIDARSDLFSLGSVLYVLCTGALPFPGKDPISTALRILDGAYESPIKLNRLVGARLDRIIRRMLEQLAAARFANAEELTTALREVLLESGIEDIDQELRRYFDDPGGYNKDLAGRIVQASLEHARQAVQRRDYPRALTLCDRALAFEPDQPQALALLGQLSARKGWVSGVIITAIVLLVAVPLAIYGVFFSSRGTVARDRAQGKGPKVALVAPMPPALPPRLDARISLDAVLASLTARPDAALDTIPSLTAKRTTRRSPRRFSSVINPDAAVQAQPDVRPAPIRPAIPLSREGELLVTITPWCDVLLDGKKVGTSPMQVPLKVAPGQHRVVCRRDTDGVSASHDVIIQAGQRNTLSGPIRSLAHVRLKLTQGDSVTVDNKATYRSDFTLPPKRYRIDLYKGNRPVAAEWVTIKANGCTLVDTPRLDCQ